MKLALTVTNFATRLGAVLVIGALATGTAKADVMSSFSFSGATFSNGSLASGTIGYTYDINNNVTAVTLANVTISAGTGAPGFKFSYNVPSVANTINAPAIVVSDTTNKVFAAQFASNTGNGEVFYPEWQGVGANAKLITLFNLADGYTSYDGARLVNAGATATQDVASAVPEPASLAILGLGLAAVTLVRRSRIG